MPAETPREFKPGDRVYVMGDQLGTVVPGISTPEGKTVVRLDGGKYCWSSDTSQLTRAVTITLPENVAKEQADLMAESLRVLSKGDFETDEIGEHQIEGGWALVNAIYTALRGIQ